MGDSRCSFIWLLGENEGTTANNNAFTLWRYIVAQTDGVGAYFVLTDTEEHRRFCRTLLPEEQTHILWKNSRRHLRLYRAADLFLVSFSVRDILPDRLCGMRIRFRLKKPLVYLQHGTTAIKKLGYTGDSYGNHLLRFMVYNPLISAEIVRRNGFAPYQLWFAGFHPRYQEMARRLLLQRQKQERPQGIVWFLTWREYFTDTDTVRGFLQTVRAVLTDPRLNAFLERSGETLTLCIHHLFDQTAGAELLALRQELSSRIRLVRQQEVDVMSLLLENRLLITDYSSVGFDFAFLGRPVLLFMPDVGAYLEKREIYCRIDELTEEASFTPEQLVSRILEGPTAVPRFYRSRSLPEPPYADIADGVYLQRMTASLLTMQERRILLFGVDYSADRAENAAALSLAEWLLGRGYRVELVSLKTHAGGCTLPCGLTHNAFYDEDARAPWHRLRRIGRVRLAGSGVAVAPYAIGALRRFWRRCRCADAIVTSPELFPLAERAGMPHIARVWTALPQDGELPAAIGLHGGRRLNTRADWEDAFSSLTEEQNRTTGGEVQ